MGGTRRRQSAPVPEHGKLAVAKTAQRVQPHQVFLTPIAAPSIISLFGFMIGTVMLGAWQAGWYGSTATPLLIWPFALMAGG
jgi:hypothetical protein